MGVQGRIFGDDVDHWWRELRHEVHAGLLGIEAGVIGLTQHGDELEPAEAEALADAVVAEVQRLHALMDVDDAGPPGDPTPYRLAEAAAPVIACVRAAGVDVRDEIPANLDVYGYADNTAQVLHSLLTNVQLHAPGAVVTVRATVHANHVALVVADDGPGIPQPLRAEVFGRGVRRPSSPGSGLGLHVARRLMDQQDGSIWVEATSGGGTTVGLVLRRKPEETRLHVVA